MSGETMARNRANPRILLPRCLRNNWAGFLYWLSWQHGENVWFLPADVENDPELYFLVLNAVNMVAKASSMDEEDDQDFWYSVKDAMLRALLQREFRLPVQVTGGVVYVDTAQGQVSFHVVDDWLYASLEDMYGTGDEYPWTGEELQWRSPELILLRLEDRE